MEALDVSSVTGRVLDQLRAAIMSGELEPGRLYSAAALGEQLGVSRTPIREASHELARLGLVEIERNRGIRIVATSVETLLQGFEVRLMLEVPLARRATRHARDEPGVRRRLTEVHERFRDVAAEGDAELTLRTDRDFHTVLLELSGNDRATSVLREQRDMVLESGVGTVPTSRTPVECFEDHADIYEAFMAGDEAAIGEAMSRHIVNTATLLIAQESRRRSEFHDHGVADRLRGLLT
ncbi:GntR family transcriptional regulator [Saccharopolyspora oryzae]|uniref:GntR family transcriptional regulator n=1 Tax=Saccharopolyspora oryzae TaxID=2997343 RepID=A0ABT4V971_9PSEU|nr:GntR family transcriptional regulator [Saccharopolyspora oryzae]MDA3630524.1 GntR family transcriptional regulator [Saccharopolyspora oryzae]